MAKSTVTKQPNIVANLKAGSILSKTSFFVVKSVNGQNVTVVDDNNNELKISNEYVNSILNSADFYTNVEKKSMTELADLFKNNPRVAMTVAFYKKDKPKLKRDIKAEKAAWVDKIQNARVGEVEALVNQLLENPVQEFIPGELRVMKGRHYGAMDDLGRIHFIDMEQSAAGATAEHDPRSRQVDPRTIQYIIVGGTRYDLK